MDMKEHIPDDPGRQTSDNAADDTQELLNDGIFSIKVSEDMTLRNNLRRGLVEAQGKNLDRMPLFVSWPNWLDDGIVCLYAKDLHQLLHDTIQQTALAFRNEFEIESMDDTPAPFAEALNGDSAPQPIPDTPSPVPTEPFQTGEEEQAAAPDEDPYTTAPPEPTPQDSTPHSDQDIADQLFAELKKNRPD